LFKYRPSWIRLAKLREHFPTRTQEARTDGVPGCFCVTPKPLRVTGKGGEFEVGNSKAPVVDRGLAIASWYAAYQLDYSKLEALGREVCGERRSRTRGLQR